MNKVIKSNFLVSVFVIILTISKTIGLSSNDKIYYVLFVFGSVLAMIKSLNDKYTGKELAILFSLFIIGCLDFFIGKETTVLFTAIVMICLKNVDIYKILKQIFYVKTIIFIGIILLILLNVIDSKFIIFYRSGEFIKRYSLIYGHPNIAHLNLSIIIILFIYLYYKKINIFSITTLIVANYTMYLFTASRTGFFVTSFCLVLAYLHKKSKVAKKIIRKISGSYFILMFIITIIFGLLYGKTPILEKANELTSGRIQFTNYFLTNISVPLIGSDNYGSYFIDNGYITLLYNGGILATIWFTIINTKTNILLSKNGMDKELLLSIIFLTYSLTESFYPNIIVNVSIFFFTYYIFNSLSKGNKNESNNFNNNI